MLASEEETIEKDSAKVNTLIDGMRLLDDFLMTMVFDGNIPATQKMINIILGRDDIIVKEVQIQKLFVNPLVGGYDVKLDVFAEDISENHYNFEIQRKSEGAGARRARFLSSGLDQRMLKHREKFDDLRDSYVIFITEKDIFKRGLPLYHVDRKFAEFDEWFGDGNHIIYANAAYDNDSTDIGKLMHDFRQTDPNDMLITELKNSTAHFKQTQEGRDRMGTEIEKYADEKSRQREIIASIKTCRDMRPGITDSQIKEYLIKEYGLSADEANSFFTPIPA